MELCLFIGNKNTHVYHEVGCPSLLIMNPENMVDTNGTGFKMCDRCNPGADGTIQQNIEKYLDKTSPQFEECHDPKYIDLFNKIGCIWGCEGSGKIMMYPHEGGTNIMGKEGKWWVFFHCDECGYDTPSWKAVVRLEKLHENKKV